MLNNFFFLQFGIEMPKFLSKLIILKLIIIFSGVGTAYSFEINRLFNDCHLDLTKKIDLTLDLALKKHDGKKIWLIYSIDCFSSFDKSTLYKKSVPENRNLTQLIYGELNQAPSGHKLERLIEKDSTQELAIILDYSLESGNPCLYQVSVQNMIHSFTKEKRPIFWLGENSPSASLNWLRYQYFCTSYQRLKKQIIAAIGAHQANHSTIEFLKHVVFGNCALPIKTEAIHSLGNHNSIESIQLLTFIAIKQDNTLLRKKAIFALSRVNEQTAKNVITKLASKAKNQEVRKEAIFWLSQIADDDALNALNKILASEPNTTIKHSALFAISQLPEKKSIPILLHIAQNNTDDKIRNKAKFWLDRTRDRRIMEFLKELDQENIPDGSK